VRALERLHEEAPLDVIWAENLAGRGYLRRGRRRLGVPIISILQGLGIRGHLRSEWNRVRSAGELATFAGIVLPRALGVYARWFRAVVQGSDGVVGISDQTVAAARREVRVDPQKLTVIYDGVDTDRFRPDPEGRARVRAATGIAAEAPVVVMAGVLSKQKGMDIGLRVFAEVVAEGGDARMLIVGDGEEAVPLHELARDLGVAERVVFTGAVPNDAMPSYLQAGDVFLNATVRAEGLSIVTVEAMACGLPVIVSRGGGTESTAEDGVSGIFVTPGDSGEVAAALRGLLADPGRARAMGDAARARACARFSLETMLADYFTLTARVVRDARERTHGAVHAS
jgi:glycosyltransferase involved in cell wall biosynthesis